MDSYFGGQTGQGAEVQAERKILAASSYTEAFAVRAVSTADHATFDQLGQMPAHGRIRHTIQPFADSTVRSEHYEVSARVKCVARMKTQ